MISVNINVVEEALEGCGNEGDGEPFRGCGVGGGVRGAYIRNQVAPKSRKS